MSQPIYCKYWQAVDGAATITGEAIKKPYDRFVSATFVWTGTLSGTIKLQHRDREGGTWMDTPNASSEFTVQPSGGGTLSVAVEFANVPGHEFRFVYTAAAGAGTMTCDISMGDRQEWSA